MRRVICYARGCQLLQHLPARFLSVYEEYKKAPEITRKRMYLETMERVLGGTDKTILDSKGGQSVVPYLSLDQLHKP